MAYCPGLIFWTHHLTKSRVDIFQGPLFDSGKCNLVIEKLIYCEALWFICRNRFLLGKEHAETILKFAASPDNLMFCLFQARRTIQKARTTSRSSRCSQIPHPNSLKHLQWLPAPAEAISHQITTAVVSMWSVSSTCCT